MKANKLLPVSERRRYPFVPYCPAIGFRAHELTFLSYYDGKPDAAYERELQTTVSWCRMGMQWQRCELSGVARGLDYLKQLTNPAPYAVSRFAIQKMQEAD